MHKLRLTATAIILAIVLASVLAWQLRDRIAATLLNAALGRVSVQELRGLKLHWRSVSLQYLRLELDSGSAATLTAKELHIASPWGLMLGSAQNKSRISLAQLDIATPATPAPTSGVESGPINSAQPKPAPAPLAAADPDARTQKAVTPPISLRHLTKNLQQRMPLEILVERISWDHPEPLLGRVQLRRDDKTRSTRIELSTQSSGDIPALEASLRLGFAPNRLQLDSRIAIASQDTPERQTFFAFNSEAGPGDNMAWRVQGTVSIDLAATSRLPEILNWRRYLRSADGELAMSIEGVIPDNLRALDRYRDFSITLEAHSVAVDLPQTLAGVPLALQLNSDAPLAAEFGTLSPLQLTSLRGTGDLSLASGKGEGPLLTAHLAGTVARQQGSLRAEGQLHTEQLETVLQAQKRHLVDGALELKNLRGPVDFILQAQVPGAYTIPSAAPAFLRNVKLQLPEATGLSMEISALPAGASPLSVLGWDSGRIKIEIPAGLTLTANRWPGAVHVAGTEIAVSARERSGDPDIRAKFTGIACEVEPPLPAPGNGNAKRQGEKFLCSADSSIHIPQLSLQELEASVGRADIVTRLRLSGSAEKAEVTLLDTAIKAGGASLGQAAADSLQVSSSKLNCNASPESISCRAPRVVVEFTAMRFADDSVTGTVVSEDLRFSQSEDQLSFSGNLSESTLQLDLRDGVSAQTRLSGRVALENQQVTSRLSAEIGDLPVSGDLSLNLATNAGQADFDFGPVAFSRDKPLSDRIAGLPVEVVAGILSGGGRLRWPQAEGSSLTLEADGIAATYGDIFVLGVSTRAKAVHRKGHWLIPATPVAIETLDPGLPVERISFSLALVPERDLVLRELRGNLLQGSLESQELRWNLDGEARHSEILVSGLSLQALEQQLETSNLAATGTVDLKIPLITAGAGVTVERGEITARAPGGRLRYYGAFSPAMLADNPQLKLLAGALEDYSYRQLSGTVEYPPSGDMQMQLKLVGRSKSLAADRDLIINLNLENNIPAMLQSLQAGRDLSETLEKRLQSATQ
ncbi:intermembrane phospholipid transport protein YdbH family protein [Microbulbifer sp. 2201CG32-9]|uniref:intermembrane phospholipid transport protein YdbH family protein n=1 Tax=Microbulbifer sp. 2201CG32-9 TaxID=3232309 RepID=UPI00345BCF38